MQKGNPTQWRWRWSLSSSLVPKPATGKDLCKLVEAKLGAKEASRKSYPKVTATFEKDIFDLRSMLIQKHSNISKSFPHCKTWSSRPHRGQGRSNKSLLKFLAPLEDNKLQPFTYIRGHDTPAHRLDLTVTKPKENEPTATQKRQLHRNQSRFRKALEENQAIKPIAAKAHQMKIKAFSKIFQQSFVKDEAKLEQFKAQLQQKGTTKRTVQILSAEL